MVCMIPNAPAMPEKCMSYFARCLSEARFYLEYGSGGSTVMACKEGLDHIVTVESDKVWLGSVEQKVSDHAGQVIFFHVDIGATKEWGFPVDDSAWRTYWNFAVAPWIRCRKEGITPDLVLIDARFRVACFYATLIYSAPGTVVLFDDYLDRSYYHDVERFLRPDSFVDRMAVFNIPAAGVNALELVPALLSAVADPR